MREYFELTKPRITSLITATTAVGFFFGRHAADGARTALLLHTLFGTALTASGTAALNQWYERDSDAKMRRTAGRPIPSGRIDARRALVFGVLISLAGFAELLFCATRLAAWLALFTLLSYLLAYTPVKQRSWLSTAIGAVPGAMPPLIGFAGASGVLTKEAFVIGAILFLWQFPHFYAIAWMYREDYSRAGILMLPVTEPDGRSTGRQMLLFASILIPVSLLPLVLNMSGRFYGICASMLGIWFLYRVSCATANLTQVAARAVLLASIAYLPLLYGCMVLDSY